MNKSQIQYSMLLEWSEEDQAYLVILPEWAPQVIMPVTHGNTYIEAVENGQEVLKMLINDAIKSGELLPQPRTHAAWWGAVEENSATEDDMTLFKSGSSYLNCLRCFVF